MGKNDRISKQDNVRYLVDNDPDYIAIKRFGNSLEKLLEKYPDGLSGKPDDVANKMVAQALALSEEEAEKEYQAVILKLRTALKVELDD